MKDMKRLSFRKEESMDNRKWKGSAVAGLFFSALCCLTGCSQSFCGFSLGTKEELVFACAEDSGEAIPDLNAQDTAVSTENETEGTPADPRDSTGETVQTSEEAEPQDSAAETVQTESALPASDGRININTAGLEELMTLNGVGESRAKAIMEYRETNGPFQTKEEIMQIPGIKEGIFSKIEEQIVVQ
jgi:competence protein ComEA